MLTGAPRGVKDILPEAAVHWQYLEATIRQICDCYGYQEIRTPVFEHTELFKRGIGDATDIVDKEMYTFDDRGGRSLTLRPENTAAVVRAYIEHKLYADTPLFKTFYIGPMFRYDRPQAGRFRQFHQFGVEAIGLSAPAVDAEIILLAVAFFHKLGLTELKLLLNSVGCPDCRPFYRQILLDFFRGQAADLCFDCRNRLERNPLRIFDCKEASCQTAITGAPLLREHLCGGCREHFARLQELLRAVKVDFSLDDKLVRGLDYYTRTAFEVQYTPLGAQSAVCGGGRYDGLVAECGGEPTPGIGFAVGLERLLLALESQNLLPAGRQNTDVFIIHAGALPAAFALSAKLRAAGVKTGLDFSGRGLKSQLKLANKLTAAHVLIIGEDELKQGVVTYKNMQTGEQERLPLENTDCIMTKIGVRDDK